MFNVRADVKAVTKYLARLEKKQVPFATRVALKKTADHIAYKTMPKVLPRIFDRPTRWTLKGFYSYQPRNRAPVAYVNIKDEGAAKGGTPAFKYLRVQMKGGSRTEKSHEKQLRAMGILWPGEFTVPGQGERINKFGNLTGATYSKILADVQGKSYRTPASSRYDLRHGQATLKGRKKQYFYDPNLRPRGIYKRVGRRKIRPALYFIASPRYIPRFPFHDISRRAATKRWPAEFRKAMDLALRTAR